LLKFNSVSRSTSFKKQYLSLSLVTILAAVSALMVVSACTNSQAKAKPNIITKDNPPAPGVVAKINGHNITEEELIGDDKIDFFDLKKKEYDLRMERLNQLIIEKMVGDQAKKANMSLDDYLNKKVVGDVKVSDSEYKKFVKEKNVPESQLTPQLKERIMGYLTQMKKQEAVQAYIAKLTKNNPVEVYFKKPKLMVNVDPGKGPWWGGKDAKVTVVEFSDFQCPYCAQGAQRVHELKKKYGNKIRFVYRQFPLPPQMHPNARQAAEASLCVNEQGMDKFWKYHDLMFKNQDKLDDAGLAKMAKEAGADPAKFEDCYKNKKYSKAVEEDMAYGEKLGVRSTPTFFINGQMINGALPVENFSEIIDEELAAKK
jgi:protein-disulfide isomerase